MHALTAGRVTENHRTSPTQCGTRTYWIAYPDWVAAYGHAGDRITRAWGTGRTRKEALANAEARAAAGAGR